MEEIDNIPEMRPSFNNIRRQDEGGNEYWSSRDLCSAMGYSAYWKFQRVIDKAIKVAGEKGMNVDDHFNQTVDMVRIGSGSFRKGQYLPSVSYGMYDCCRKCRCQKSVGTTSSRLFYSNNFDKRIDAKFVDF